MKQAILYISGKVKVHLKSGGMLTLVSVFEPPGTPVVNV